MGSRDSLVLSGAILSAFGVTAAAETETSQGAALESLVESSLRARLGDGFAVRRGGHIWDYSQYAHLKQLDLLAQVHPELRAVLGQNYQITPDVCVGRGHRLHANVSCKLTIRSDRVQNTRQEFRTMATERRGRTPHMVVVTCEPLPSRIASIADGSDVDAVYHPYFAEINAAIAGAGASQQVVWARMVAQGRLKPYSALAIDLQES